MTDLRTRDSADSPPVSTLLTFLIADVRGYTQFTAGHGDEAAAQLARRFAELVEEVVGQYGGQVTELRGDEALSVFPSARNALRAAVALQTAFRDATDEGPSLPLRVGMGLDAGEAIPVKGGYRGGALNLAARLCGIAGAGEVFCSETVIGLAHKTEGIAFVDRGEVSLKGLSAPVRVIQIGPEGELPDELPPLQPILVTHPTNLPDEPTPFIGREREIEQIAGLLRHPSIRMVTLTGPGGTGKTRLALQVGATLLHDFRHGVFFVNLAPLTDPVLVASAIAEVLSVKEEAGKDVIATLADVLKEKHLLLVLDNHEHLLDASSVTASLLDGCKELHVLVTSRVPLHLSREHEYPVAPLSVPDPRHLPDLARLSQYEAVALFIERAQAIKPDFQVTNVNAPAVAEICYRLDGLPLAVELAAARIKLFPPQALLQRLSNRLKLLTGGAKDRPSRQQTLRGAIEWSYSLLSPAEQSLFAQLSIFAGGCTFAAAEAICHLDAGSDLLDAMASLVDKSLLSQKGEEEPRFVMLETIREYAAERLEDTGVFEELKREHAQYYLALAEEAGPELSGPEQAAWMQLMEAERDNLRAALQRARDSGDLNLGLRLAVSLSGFWAVRGPRSEGRRWLEELAALPGGSRGLQAAALSAAAKMAEVEGRRGEAADLFRQSLHLYRDLDDRQGGAEAVGGLAGALFQSGEAERAFEIMREAERRGRATGDKALLAVSLHLLAGATVLQGDARNALDLGEESLALYRERDDTRGAALALQILASAAYSLGEVPRARALIDELLTISSRIPLDTEKAGWRESLAYTARTAGDYEYAAHLLEELSAGARAVGDRRLAARARGGLGLLARERGNYHQAAALCEESLAALREVEDPLGISRALIGLSDVARDQGDAERVVQLCDESLELLGEIRDVPFTAYALHNLGLAAWYQGDYHRAESLIAQSLALFQGLGDALNTAEILSSVGLLALDQGNYDRAEEAFAKCLVTARRSGAYFMMATLLEGVAGVAAAEGRGERAAQLFGAAEALRTAIGTPRWPALLSLYNRYVEVAERALEQEFFVAARERGRAMSPEEAVAYALGERV